MATIERWLATWAALSVPASARVRELHGQLASRYSEPHRHYHTLQHLTECFERLDELRGHAANPAEVEVAMWYHDAVYDTHRGDNEQQSAELARQTALDLGISGASAQRIHDLVMSTRHAVEPVGADAEALVDTDLSILGAGPARFDEYERQVRLEYAWVPEAMFRERRADILRRFLDRPHIFSTAVFRERYEPAARANLRRSLEALAHATGTG
jgi:predicted metal-dependent HD superfamily phosphohydrolase